MAAKLGAIPLPELAGKRVLDVGCDHAYWSFLAARAGAAKVVGLDRNRDVRGRGFTNLIAQNEAIARHDAGLRVCEFAHINLGQQWREFGKFDVVLVLSVYHHIFEQCGDHSAIWCWLSRHCRPDAVVLWEGPVDESDPVVQINVGNENRKGYSREAILEAARVYFEAEFIGPAVHEPTREVWRFRALTRKPQSIAAVAVDGVGGATLAFEYEGGRRIGEIDKALGFRPVVGSLNLKLAEAFDWNRGYYRAKILDVEDRSKGFHSAWTPRWARFYPLKVNDTAAFAMRFEGDVYRRNFMEVIASQKFRDGMKSSNVTVHR